MKKTWFITGASRGFGRIWAEAALERGDRVTATARKLADVSDLAERFGDAVLPLALDVTDSAQVEQAVHQAYCSRLQRKRAMSRSAASSMRTTSAWSECSERLCLCCGNKGAATFSVFRAGWG
jgi:putative NADH-flavin reductase